MSTGIQVSVSDAVISTDAALSETGHGAQILFSGVVRDSNLGRQVRAVSYDAFAPLAIRVLEEICAEAQARWGEGLIFRVQHRTGTVRVGESSLLIAVSSPHRDEAYQASRYVIEQIKVRAPIWKKEHYLDGESEWLKGHALCNHALPQGHDMGNGDELQALRYGTQMRLAEIGEMGQAKLKQARVLCIGAGGLGAPVLFYLTAAGVGHIGIVDPDTVDLSNLQRQILFKSKDQGRLKVEAAREQLTALNPLIEIVSFPVALSADNALFLARDYDVIVDCTDHFDTKFLLNDVALKLGKPLVYASVTGWDGQVATFSGRRQGPCYRCLYPRAPVAAIPNCGEAGVLGAVVGVIGSLQGLQVIQCLLGDVSAAGRLHVFDAKTQELSSFKITQRPGCKTCSSSKEAISLGGDCSQSETSEDHWLDVRTAEEWRSGHIPHAVNFPLDRLENGEQPEISKTASIRVYCATGARSSRAAARLKAAGFEKVATLERGLRQWQGTLAKTD